MIRLSLIALATAALIYCAWIALLYFQQRQLLFPGAGVAMPAADPMPVGVERHWLEIPGGRAEAWLLKANPGAVLPAPTIIFAHGNGEFIDQFAGSFATFTAAGLNVLLVEYPGYGRSSGAPSETSVTATFVAAYDWLASRPDVDAQRVVGMGRSLGGGAITALAGQRDVAAIVLRSTFTSVTAIARDYWAPGWLARDRFDNRAVLREYSGPVLLGHGRNDRIIAYAHGQRLAAAAGVALTTWDCGHNDCPPDWSTYLASVIAFLRGNDLL